jgi:hypothetical protein
LSAVLKIAARTSPDAGRLGLTASTSADAPPVARPRASVKKTTQIKLTEIGAIAKRTVTGFAPTLESEARSRTDARPPLSTAPKTGKSFLNILPIGMSPIGNML